MMQEKFITKLGKYENTKISTLSKKILRICIIHYYYFFYFFVLSHFRLPRRQSLSYRGVFVILIL